MPYQIKIRRDAKAYVNPITSRSFTKDTDVEKFIQELLQDYYAEGIYFLIENAALTPVQLTEKLLNSTELKKALRTEIASTPIDESLLADVKTFYLRKELIRLQQERKLCTEIESILQLADVPSPNYSLLTKKLGELNLTTLQDVGEFFLWAQTIGAKQAFSQETLNRIYFHPTIFASVKKHYRAPAFATGAGAAAAPKSFDEAYAEERENNPSFFTVLQLVDFFEHQSGAEKRLRTLLGKGLESIDSAKQALAILELQASLTGQVEQTKIAQAKEALQQKEKEKALLLQDLEKDPQLNKLSQETCTAYLEHLTDGASSSANRLQLLCTLWSIKGWDETALWHMLRRLTAQEDAETFGRSDDNLLIVLVRHFCNENGALSEYGGQLIAAFHGALQQHIQALRESRIVISSSESSYSLPQITVALFSAFKAACDVGIPSEIEKTFQTLEAAKKDPELWKTIFSLVYNRIWGFFINTVNLAYAHESILPKITNFNSVFASIFSFARLQKNKSDGQDAVFLALFEVYGREMLQLLTQLMVRFFGETEASCREKIFGQMVRNKYCGHEALSQKYIETSQGQQQELSRADIIIQTQAKQHDSAIALYEAKRHQAKERAAAAGEILQAPPARITRFELKQDSSDKSWRYEVETTGELSITALGCSGDLGKAKDKVLEGIAQRQGSLRAIFYLGDECYKNGMPADGNNAGRLFENYYVTPNADIQLPMFFTKGNHEGDEWSWGAKSRTVAADKMRVLQEQMEDQQEVIGHDDHGNPITKFNMPADYYLLSIKSTLDNTTAYYVVMDSSSLPRDAAQRAWLKKVYSELVVKKAEAMQRGETVYIVGVSHHGTTTVSSRAMKSSEIKKKPYDIQEEELSWLAYQGDCSLIVTSRPLDIKNLRFFSIESAKAAYIRSEDKLFYINKEREEYIQLDKVSVEAFDKALGSNPQALGMASIYSEQLSAEQTIKISRLTGHAHTKLAVDASRNMYDLNRAVLEKLGIKFDQTLKAHDHYQAVIGNEIGSGGGGGLDKTSDFKTVTPGTSFVAQVYGTAFIHYEHKQISTEMWELSDVQRCWYKHTILNTTLDRESIYQAQAVVPVDTQRYKVDVPFKLLTAHHGKELFSAIIAAAISKNRNALRECFLRGRLFSEDKRFETLSTLSFSFADLRPEALIQMLFKIRQFIQDEYVGKIKSPLYHQLNIIALALNILCDPVQRTELLSILGAEEGQTVEPKKIIERFEELGRICLPYVDRKESKSQLEARGISAQAVFKSQQKRFKRIYDQFDAWNKELVTKLSGDRASSLQAQFKAYLKKVEALKQNNETLSSTPGSGAIQKEADFNFCQELQHSLSPHLLKSPEAVDHFTLQLQNFRALIVASERKTEIQAIITHLETLLSLLRSHELTACEKVVSELNKLLTQVIEGTTVELEKLAKEAESNTRQALELQEYLQPVQQFDVEPVAPQRGIYAAAAAIREQATGVKPTSTPLIHRLSCIVALKNTLRQDVAIILRQMSFHLTIQEKLALGYIWKYTVTDSALAIETFIDLALKGDIVFCRELLCQEAEKYLCLAQGKPYDPRQIATGLMIFDQTTHHKEREMKNYFNKFGKMNNPDNISLTSESLTKALSAPEYVEKVNKVFEQIKAIIESAAAKSQQIKGEVVASATCRH
ncbi:MAG: hypothetical protein K0S08_1914 [Gammaproteobacteria bacterium]|jgi:hypothetical protein|nr:hypothetical protein [Gammaproteobacteria bacterium]